VSAGTRVPDMIGPDLRSTRVLATLDCTPGEVFRPQNTQPFRHKGWVFAMTGDTCPAVPQPDDAFESDFLMRNVRGHSDLERAANLIMCRMLRTLVGRARIPEPEVIRQAIAGVLDPLESDDFKSYAAVLTGGRRALVVHKGDMGVYHRSVKGAPEGRRHKDGVVAGSEHVRATVVVAGMEPAGKGWKKLADDTMLVVDEAPPARVIPIKAG